jgi:Ser/Thr protein kinase RdoA (MazF antagonist)
MYNDCVEKVLRHYRVVTPPYLTKRLSTNNLWVINNQVVLKQIKSRKRIENICFLLDALKDSEIACKYIPTSDGRSFVEYADSYYIVYEYLAGAKIDVEDFLNNKTALEGSCGRKLAELHGYFANIRKKGFSNPDLMMDYDLSLRTICNEGFVIMDYILKECELFRQSYNSLPKQLIHRDIQLRNIITNRHEDICFVDFDSCEVNVRIYDLAYFGVTLLHDMDLGQQTDLELWREAIKTIICNYNSVNKLTSIEMLSLNRLILVIQICFIRYYFCLLKKRETINLGLCKLSGLYELLFGRLPITTKC